jgi:putative transposase
MRNHVHFVAVPAEADSLARSFSETHAQYTRRVNLREKWQGRFGSSVLDQHHLLAAVRYVERNPVRARIVADAWEYPCSSAAFHVGKTNDAGIVSSDTILPELIGDWETYLESPDQKDFLESVHSDSPVNRPLGDAAFVDSLERKYQLKMTRGKAGRPAVRKQPSVK